MTLEDEATKVLQKVGQESSSDSATPPPSPKTSSQYNWNYSHKTVFVTISVDAPRDHSHKCPWRRLGISSSRKPIIIVRKSGITIRCKACNLVDRSETFMGT